MLQPELVMPNCIVILLGLPRLVRGHHRPERLISRRMVEDVRPLDHLLRLKGKGKLFPSHRPNDLGNSVLGGEDH
jgi:hypothetical protein